MYSFSRSLTLPLSLVGAGEVVCCLLDRTSVQAEKDAAACPRHGQVRVKLKSAFVMVLCFGEVVAPLMGFVA